MLALRDELDQLEGKGESPKPVLVLSFIAAILLFEYGSLMLEVFGAVFGLTAVGILISDIRRGNRRKTLERLIEEFEDGEVDPSHFS